MKRLYDAKLFDGKCPYTDKPCYEWKCNTCEVEEQEKEYMKAVDDADHKEWFESDLQESEEISDHNMKMWEDIFKAERSKQW